LREKRRIWTSVLKNARRQILYLREFVGGRGLILGRGGILKGLLGKRTNLTSQKMLLRGEGLID